jgi:uncharacterized phage-associated protein
VCRELFDLHRGWCEISEDDIREKYLSGKKLSRQEKDTINQILKDYGMHSGAKLCEIARGEDPWLNAKNGEVISHESILKYYASLDPVLRSWIRRFFSSALSSIIFQAFLGSLKGPLSPWPGMTALSTGA